MKAIIFNKEKKPTYVDIKEPEINKLNMVKIRVDSSGLCGSDIHRIKNDNLENRILGHEFSGTVEEIGSSVSTINIGDRIVAIPFIPCYECKPCVDEEYALCYNLEAAGKTVQGAFAEKIIMPGKNLIRIKETMSSDIAALTDVVAVALHVYNLANKPNNKEILIIGDGTIGISNLQLFKYHNNNITVIGKNNGVHVTSNGGKYVPSNSINDLPNNYFDVIVECVGGKQESTLNESIRLIKPKGKIIIDGVFKKGYTPGINARELFYKEAILQGSNSYSISINNNEFLDALNLIEKGVIDVNKLISYRLHLSKFQEGLNMFQDKERYNTLKIIFNP